MNSTQTICIWSITIQTVACTKLIEFNGGQYMAKDGGQNMATPMVVAIFWPPRGISGGGKNLALHL